MIAATAYAADDTVVPKLPESGQAQTVTAPQPDATGLANIKGLATSSGQKLKAFPKAESPTTRGAAEATIYQRISPAVVMIVTQEGLGSGSIISADGTILTNRHVVGTAKRVGVIFKPATEGEDVRQLMKDKDQIVIADVVKVDAARDLAIIKVPKMPDHAPDPIKLAAFESVKIGDDAHAIGHPTGEAWTYTKGYVSQIRRGYEWGNREENIKHKADVIQTQTPINPGNSGGPLLNNSGMLIGVNAFKGDGEGLNYAIAVSDVRAFLDETEAAAPVMIASTAQTSAPQSSDCKPHLLFEGRNKQNDARIREFDMQCHGNPDLVEILPDDKAKPLFCLVDEKETGKPNGMIVSKARDGHWDISYWDTTGNGKWDTIGYHPDGKLVPSSYGPYIPKD